MVLISRVTLKLTKMLKICRKRYIWSLTYKRRLVNLQNLFVNSQKKEVARDIYFTCLFDRRSRLPTIIRWLSLEQRKFCYISPTQNTAFVSCQVYHSLQKCFSTFEFFHVTGSSIYCTTTFIIDHAATVAKSFLNFPKNFFFQN